MNDPLAALDEAVASVRSAWTTDASGSLACPSEIGRAQLLGIMSALGAVTRHLDAVRVEIAAQIARESRSELGAESLAKQNGFRTPAVMIAATSGVSTGDATRLIRIGEATASRPVFAGEPAPPRYPYVAQALGSGTLGAAGANAIITMLDRVGASVDRAACDDVERLLVTRAPGLPLDDLLRLITRAEAQLDAARLERREHDLRSQRSVTMYERDGLLHLTAKLDPESGAPVKAAIEALVTAEFRTEHAVRPVGFNADADAPRRTLAQRQADALSLLAAHAVGCSSNLPIQGATVVVRMTLEQCATGDGVATIDGMAQPISARTARRMAASGGVIPWVLGGESDILDWGRTKRLFTKAQRIALVERDGGCAMCALPPGMTKAHHLKWWQRDNGPTDLSNGVLLCESCHHRIHDNGWEIRIDGTGTTAQVWFVPPADVDPKRTPRLGGRARFDFLAAA